MGDWLPSLLMPLVTPAGAVLVLAIATALAAVVIGPWVQLKVAGKQFVLGTRQADLAEKQLALVERQAAGGEASARAALLTAESSGRHAVARFRQEWINSLRRDLAELHSLLTAASEAGLTDERSTAIAELRTRIELMLNPEEPAADDLLDIIDHLLPPLQGDPLILNATFIAKSQMILKAEWKRVKEELQGPHAGTAGDD